MSVWSAGAYERLAQLFAPIQDDLVARLEPGPAVRWLDVGTGTGETAIRAVRAGADVTAVDIEPTMLEQARAKAGPLPIRFDEGDAQKLPYGDSAFDVVSSNFGVVHAPDHAAAAAELARVTAPGGRLGLTAWFENEQHRIQSECGVPVDEGGEAYQWSEAGHARGLLGESFELELERRQFFLEGESGEEVWELFSSAAPPIRAFLDSVEPERGEALGRALVEYYESYRDGDRVRVPRPYRLILGRRR